MLSTPRPTSGWGPGTLLMVFGLWQLSILLAVGVTWRIAREAAHEPPPLQVVVNGEPAERARQDEPARAQTRLSHDSSLLDDGSAAERHRLLRERDEASNALLRLAFADLLTRAASNARNGDRLRLPQLAVRGAMVHDPLVGSLRDRLDQGRHGTGRALVDAWGADGLLSLDDLPIEDLQALDAWLGELRANFTVDDLLRDTEAFDALQGNLDYLRARLASLQALRGRFDGGLDNVDDALDALRGLTDGALAERLQGLLPLGANVGGNEQRRALLTFILMQRMGGGGVALP